jgi:5-methyltetrahydropteroyltriglutamate--homocysteine methyltransferase
MQSLDMAARILALEPLYEEAVRDTIEQFAATGSPIVTDGEQRKYQNFATYCVDGLPNTAPDGFKLPFAAGHTRRLPRLTGGPFRFLMFGYDYLDLAFKYAHVPVKQAVISASALSLMYPAVQSSRILSGGIHQGFARRA